MGQQRIQIGLHSADTEQQIETWNDESQKFDRIDRGPVQKRVDQRQAVDEFQSRPQGERSAATAGDLHESEAPAAALRPQGHKFKVTAKGGDRGRRFVEWQLLRLYAFLLFFNLAGIVVAFMLHVRGDSIAYGNLALAWSWYNAFVLMLVCFVCIEQPRRRKAERFQSDEAVQLASSGISRIYRLSDISITGARFRGAMPEPVGSLVRCTLRGHTVKATIVREVPGGFAVQFDESLPARIEMVRNFYAEDYITAFSAVEPTNVGKAVFSRIFG